MHCGAGQRGFKFETEHEKGIGVKALDGVEIILAQAQQVQIGALNVAVGHARVRREFEVDEGAEVDAFEILTQKGQAGL